METETQATTTTEKPDIVKKWARANGFERVIAGYPPKARGDLRQAINQASKATATIEATSIRLHRHAAALTEMKAIHDRAETQCATAATAGTEGGAA